MLYCSASASLAALEYFVHADPDDAPTDLILIPVHIPAAVAVSEIVVAELPAGWRSLPAPEALAELGTEWARRASTAVLSVPSAVVPEERNYLVNPAHAAFGDIGFGAPRPFSFDPRMWKPPRR